MKSFGKQNFGFRIADAAILKPRGGEERINLDRGNKFTVDYAGEYKIKFIAESFGYNATYTKSVFVKAPEKLVLSINSFIVDAPTFETFEVHYI